jgi:hydroxymethylpyrimidine pyrophosphatase-like HAD family hydrolase
METSMIHTNESILIGCDIDGTLLAGDRAEDSVKEVANTALQALTMTVAHRRNRRNSRNHRGAPIFFGTATGRTEKSREELVQDNLTFRFAASYMDFSVTSLARIAVREDRHEPLTHLESWPNVENWDPRKIREVLSAAAGLGTITLQEDYAQSTHKLSLYVKTELGHDEYVDRVSQYLDEWGITAHAVLSGTEEIKFLDFVPKQANGKPVDKGAALLHTANFLAERDSLDNLPRMIFADDSPNGIGGFHAAIEAGGYGIVPGNADQDFQRWAQTEFGDSVHVARQPFATGVQEGFEHFTRRQI